MVHLVEQDGQVGQFAYLVAQFVGHTIFLVVRLIVEVKQPIPAFVDTIEYHLLSIGHSHKAEEFSQGFVYGYLLHIRVLGAV